MCIHLNAFEILAFQQYDLNKLTKLTISDEEYTFDNQTMEELGIDSLDEGTLVGSDDLVEYSGGEEEIEEETVYIKSEVRSCIYSKSSYR